MRLNSRKICKTGWEERDMKEYDSEQKIKERTEAEAMRWQYGRENVKESEMIKNVPVVDLRYLKDSPREAYPKLIKNAALVIFPKDAEGNPEKIGFIGMKNISATLYSNADMEIMTCNGSLVVDLSEWQDMSKQKERIIVITGNAVITNRNVLVRNERLRLVVIGSLYVSYSAISQIELIAINGELVKADFDWYVECCDMRISEIFLAEQKKRTLYDLSGKIDFRRVTFDRLKQLEPWFTINHPWNKRTMIKASSDVGDYVNARTISC